jgi:ATP-dependent HslUV protease ATP-binding subunit HslU
MFDFTPSITDPMSQLTPSQIVAELDKNIVGQNDAKRAVAVALRNRWRRQQLPDDLREEVMPKNILMIGPTGVGKTEIARRLAKLADAPFLKVEATKFTEVGYVGRDVEQIVRDLVEVAINMSRTRSRKDVVAKAETAAEERLVDALVGKSALPETRAKFRTMLKAKELEDREVEVELSDDGSLSMPTIDVPGMPGAQMGMLNLGDIFGKAMGRTKVKKMKIEEARPRLVDEEADKLLDQEKLVGGALDHVQQNGIVFIDEIDKIAGRSEFRGGGDVSREGVQRDLLPLIEGTTVSTKYGMVKTDHILFIASGAFHMAKPADLLPELQGRLPIRVELQALTADDFRKILTDTQASLIRQYKALMGTEGLTLEFTDEAVDEIARLAAQINMTVENIGARRLHTVLERLLEEISFDADARKGESLKIDAAMVRTRVGDLAKDADLSKFIL